MINQQLMNRLIKLRSDLGNQEEIKITIST